LDDTVELCSKDTDDEEYMVLAGG